MTFSASALRSFLNSILPAESLMRGAFSGFMLGLVAFGKGRHMRQAVSIFGRAHELACGLSADAIERGDEASDGRLCASAQYDVSDVACGDLVLDGRVRGAAAEPVTSTPSEASWRSHATDYTGAAA